MVNDSRLKCNFCGKSQEEVKKFISGGSVRICDGCIEKSYAMLHFEEEFVFFYEPKHYFLSNFSCHKVFYRHRWWDSAEHAYQAAKFFDDAIIDEIALAHSPEAAKEIASYYPDRKRPDWGVDLKLEIMEEILRAKLAAHPFILDWLLDHSGELHLVENSPSDPFWGWGKDHKGLNMLGRLWMKLREEKRLLLRSNVVQLRR